MRWGFQIESSLVRSGRASEPLCLGLDIASSFTPCIVASRPAKELVVSNGAVNIVNKGC